MTKSRTEIQKKSDEKRGVKVKAIKLPLPVIAEFEHLAQQAGQSQAAFFSTLIEVYKQHNPT